MLAGMDQDLSRHRAQRPAHHSGLDELRTRADDRADFHADLGCIPWHRHRGHSSALSLTELKKPRRPRGLSNKENQSGLLCYFKGQRAMIFSLGIPAPTKRL